MKVIVLGSGVIGTTTAYFLALAGHEVTVIERQSGAAMETSFANAGQVSPGLAAPWAGPWIPANALKLLTMRHSPLVLRPGFDLRRWRWLGQMLMNCNAKSYELNKSRMVRVAEYSRDCLLELRAATGIAYDGRSKGTLQLFRTQEQQDASAFDTAVLDRSQVPYSVLDVAGCEVKEPALALVRGAIIGGLHLPGDETGDCFKFTQALASKAEALGVKFQYGVAIERLVRDNEQISSVVTSLGELKADSFVVALGSYSPLLLRPIGLDLPVYPVKGHSITLPIVEPSAAPESTIMDETYKVCITRMGERIRVGGTAEIAGYDLTLRSARRAALAHVVKDLFPRGGDMAQASFWCGLRPMTPDGTPILGPTPYRNLFLNTGHGSLGWTMSCGSARVLADLVSGRTPEIAMDGLALDRYGKFKLPALQPVKV